MKTTAVRPATHRPTVVLSFAVTGAMLTACGDGSSPTPQDPVVTVTATPTVTAGSVGGSSTDATNAKALGPKSDVVGRTFDLGTIVKVVKDGGVQVIIFDRWTARGVADATLAANGVPIGVHSDAPYENQNSSTTFRIPVVEGAIFTYSHCVAVDQPAQQRSSTLREFAGLQASENVVLLTLDPKGHAFKAQNDPAC